MEAESGGEPPWPCCRARAAQARAAQRCEFVPHALTLFPFQGHTMPKPKRTVTTKDQIVAVIAWR